MKLQEVTRTTLVQRGHEERGGGRLALARQVRARGQSLLRGQQQPHQLIHNLRAQIQHGKHSLLILYPFDISIEHMLTLLTFQTLPQDSGPYRCRVDFWKAATRNYKIYLHLVEQADSVRIYDGGDTEVDSEQLRRGMLLSVLCACAGDGGRAGGAGQLHAGADMQEPGRPPPALPQLAELQTPASAGQPGHQLSYYLS